jgi:hypothetical protein
VTMAARMRSAAICTEIMDKLHAESGASMNRVLAIFSRGS